MGEIMSLKQTISKILIHSAMLLDSKYRFILYIVAYLSITCYFSSNETFNLHLMEKGVS